MYFYALYPKYTFYRYDAYIKVETITTWWPDFIQALDLTSQMYPDEPLPCLLNLPKAPCRGEFEVGHMSRGPISTWSTNFMKKSGVNLGQYYTKAVADMVYEMYRADFRLYGYVYWDGLGPFILD